MNKFIVIAAAVCAAIIVGVTGCKHTPATDTVYMVAHTGGAGTALVMNETSLSAEKRTVIRDITKEVREFIPEVEQTLESAWTPIAQAHVDLLIEEGKIDTAAGAVIMAGFKTVMVGVTLLETRYPQVRASRDLLNAFITGFTDGFLAKFDVYCDDGECRTLMAAAPALCDRTVITGVRRAAIRNGLK